MRSFFVLFFSKRGEEKVFLRKRQRAAFCFRFVAGGGRPRSKKKTDRSARSALKLDRTLPSSPVSSGSTKTVSLGWSSARCHRHPEPTSECGSETSARRSGRDRAKTTKKTGDEDLERKIKNFFFFRPFSFLLLSSISSHQIRRLFTQTVKGKRRERGTSPSFLSCDRKRRNKRFFF